MSETTPNPDAARFALMRDEIAGLMARLDTLEQRTETLTTRSDALDARVAHEGARQEAQSGDLEGLARSAAAARTRIDDEVARADVLDDGMAALVRRVDGLEEQLLRVAGRADGNAAAVEALEKRLTVSEEAIRRGDLRIGILESRDEADD